MFLLSAFRRTRPHLVAAALLSTVILHGEVTNASEAGPRLLVSSRYNNRILRYNATTGAFVDTFVPSGSGGLNAPFGITIGPDNNLYVSGYSNNAVLRYDGTSGAFKGSFAPSGGGYSGELTGPWGLRFGPDNNLYVNKSGTAGSTRGVLRYNGGTGKFIDNFANSGGLQSAFDCAFDGAGGLYVTDSIDNSVKKYNGTTGQFQSIFASGGGLLSPTGLTFGPDGNLYVASSATGAILRYDGASGQFLNVFASGFPTPIGITFGPDGNLYACSESADAVLRFDGKTGASLGYFIAPGSGGLDGAEFMVFVPEPATLGLLALSGLMVVSPRRRTKEVGSNPGANQPGPAKPAC